MPKLFDLAGVPTKVLFAPVHTPELEIMKQMLKGANEVVFAIFTFAGSSGIDDTMLALARGGMTITRRASTAARRHRVGPRRRR